MEKISIKLDGLSCANCAAKIEERSAKIPGLSNVIVDISRSKLIAYTEKKDKETFVDEVKKIVNALEPHVKVSLETGRERRTELVTLPVCTTGCCDGDSHDHGHGHDHGHHHEKGTDDHGHSHDVTFKIEQGKKVTFTHDKPTLIRLFASLALLVVGILTEATPWLSIASLLTAYALSGYKVLNKSFKNIMRGQIFDENFLMSIATIGAIAIREYPEAVAVMIFYEIGEYFQNFAVTRSKNAISALMDIRPDSATVFRNGAYVTVDPMEVNVGETIIVKPGERIPLDGVVLEGKALIDTAALTGESVPVSASEGVNVLSGSVVKDGLLKIKVESYFEESTVSRILDLVENATANKAHAEFFITRFAKYYTPFVVFAAIALATIPPFLLGMGAFSDWLYNGLVFLVISCPCALVVSVPLTFFSGIGNASKNGILIKGSNYLEALSTVDTVVFDKTGTLTEGVFEVSNLILAKESLSIEDIKKHAAMAELHSNHPIAKSIVSYYGKAIDENEILDYEEISGHGTRLKTADGITLIGNKKWMMENNVQIATIDSLHTLLYLAHNGEYLGAFEIRDKVKADASSAIKGLKAMGVHTVMLTGDRQNAAQSVADTLGIDEFKSELLPQDKYTLVQSLIDQNQKVAFVGDGINDAPVLAGATVGISMGSIGSDAAIEASDVVLMTDEPSKILKSIEISKRTRRIVTQNIAFALGVKFAIMGLSTIGLSSMWMAIFADVGVSLLAVLNAMRAMRS